MQWILHDLSGGPLPAATDKLQVLQSKHRTIVTNAPWCVSKMQIHVNLAVPFFADHITTLTENFAWKLSGVWKQLIWCLGRHLYWSLRGGLKSRTIVIIVDCSKPVETIRNKATKSVARLVFHALVDYLDWDFVWFSSKSRVQLQKRQCCSALIMRPSAEVSLPTNTETVSLCVLNPQTSIERTLSFQRTNCL